MIEYKYINSGEDAKRVCDEILADVGGYASETYDHLMFVIYETRRFRREDEWQAALDQSNANTELTSILLKGMEASEADRVAREANRPRKRVPSGTKRSGA